MSKLILLVLACTAVASFAQAPQNAARDGGAGEDKSSDQFGHAALVYH